jgi:dihydroorotate dehydrogenase
VRQRYGIDLSASCLGVPLPHPIGKASGQLSLNVRQLEQDREAGLAFVVLKTVIGERADGSRTIVTLQDYY